MSEGPDRVKQAVRRARHSGIFMVFVIVDNPESKVTTVVCPLWGHQIAGVLLWSSEY
jgi:hypothetical protein